MSTLIKVAKENTMERINRDAKYMGVRLPESADHVGHRVIGSVGGGLAGAGLGVVGGPVGMAIGGAIGSTLGVGLADRAYDKKHGKYGPNPRKKKNKKK